MNNKTRFSWLSLTLALVLLGGGVAPTASAAVLDQVRGDVQIVPAGAVPPAGGRPASAGAAVNPGEIIRVGPDSQARLQLPDGTQMEIFARTEIVFNEDLSDPEAKGHLLGLIWGRVLSRVVPRKEGGAPYKMVTPATVCGIRGTEFMVAVADDGETRVGVEKGEVEVSGADGSELLPAGTETRILVGEKPLRPVRTLFEKINWEGWLVERNARVREKLADRVAALGKSAQGMDARLDQLNRRIQKLETDARELARRKREAVERGSWDQSRDLETRLQASLDEGVKVNGLIAEASERREIALASGERVLAEVSGRGEELSGRVKKLADELGALRASLTGKIQADREVYGKRLRAYEDLFRDYGRKAQGLFAPPGLDQQALERWNKLSPEKQEELKRKYRQWKSLPEETRQKVLSSWERFQKMSLMERREILKNLRDFERLGVDEKARIKERLERWRSLPPEKREEIKRKFRRFQALSPEERRAVLERLRNRRENR